MILAMLGILAWMAGAFTMAEPATFTLEQVRSDFDQCVEAIRADHPKTFVDSLALEAEFELRRSLLIEGMTAGDFYHALALTVAEVRCGHTRTYLPEDLYSDLKQRNLCLPLDVRIIGDDLYVNHCFAEGAGIPCGAAILAIDGNDKDTIITTMLAGLPADGSNETYKRSALNLRFPRLYAQFFGCAPAFFVAYTAPGATKLVSVRVDALSLSEIGDLKAEAEGSTDRPRWESKIEPDAGYAYLRVGDFSYYEDPAIFNNPIGEFFAVLQHQQIGTLILDLRDNDGGDPNCSAFLFRQLLDHGAPYFGSDTLGYENLVSAQPVPDTVFTGKLFVLINGETFSSSTHLCALLRYHDRGVFIGEDTGGSWICNDASKMHTLEHTGVRVSIPRWWYAVAVQGMEPGENIPPDVPVKPTVDDLIDRRDAVLETAVRMVKESKVAGSASGQ